MTHGKYKLVYLTPSLYIAGGVERVLTMKASYFADHYGYDVTIVLTDGLGKPFAYPLSDKVKVINLDIGFEQLWTCSFLQKIPVYLYKQWSYRRRLAAVLQRLRPDITISLLRREINFVGSLKDGSKKVGELHVNRANYRNFEANDTNWLKRRFAEFWQRQLVRKLQQLDAFCVLTNEDAGAWAEITPVYVIPDPLPFPPGEVSPLTSRRVLAVGRYVYQKGFDLLLQAWKQVEAQCPGWELHVFGDGNREPYEEQARQLGLDPARCQLHGVTDNVRKEYLDSSLFVFSSRFEGFGMALVEAMACGLPVVSFDCPCGPKDIISHDENGLLVPAGNVAALARTMAGLMQHPETMKRLAEAARKSAEYYRMESLATEWRHCFESL